MAVMPISDSDVKAYLGKRCSQIVDGMSAFLKCELIISPQNIIYVKADSMDDKNGNRAMARFEYNSNTIKINCSRIASKCQDMMYDEEIFWKHKNDVFLFSELILEHELAHLYQKQGLKRDMKLDVAHLEVEADKIAIEYFTTYNDKDDELIQKIISYYKNMHSKYLETL